MLHFYERINNDDDDDDDVVRQIACCSTERPITMEQDGIFRRRPPGILPLRLVTVTDRSIATLVRRCGTLCLGILHLRYL